MNLAILFGQKGRLPVYFERTPGSTADVTTLHNILKIFKTLETKTLHYVMDKGFYSKKNIDDLLAPKDKFILSVSLKNCVYRMRLMTSIKRFQEYQKLDNEIIYLQSRLHPWENSRTEISHSFMPFAYSATAFRLSAPEITAESVINRM